jgi:hypothetical protein
LPLKGINIFMKSGHFGLKAGMSDTSSNDTSNPCLVLFGSVVPEKKIKI